MDNSPLNYSRRPLSGNVFEDTPPPLYGEVQDGVTADGGAELAGIKIRVREGRVAGRAAASRSPARPPPRPPFRSSSRSPSPPSFLAPTSPIAAVIPRERQQVGKRIAMSLEDSLPWDEELANIKDDGYATPPDGKKLAPDAYSTGIGRHSTRRETVDWSNGRHSAPPGGRSPRPRSTDGRPLSPLPLAGAWQRGMLCSPVTAGILVPSLSMPRPTSSPTSRTSTPERLFVQTAIFADLGTLSSTDDIGFTSPSLAARLWRSVTYPPRALLSACQGLVQRMAGWFAGFL